MHRRLPTLATLSLTLSFALGLGAPATLAAPVAPEPAADTASAALFSGQVNIKLETSGFVQPLGVVNAGDGTNRLFVVEQRGTVRVVRNGVLQPGFFLDIRNVGGGISAGGERGLLGLAFHPSFESNRTLFVYYTRGDGDIVIAEMTANAARTSAATSTLDPIFASPIEHSAQSNHNGGQLMFGPDNNLYIFVGDGGGSGDPYRSAQDINSRLGKILRVTPDLNGGANIPPSNPYVGEDGSDVVWNIGLRNPWRASFDSETGQLWIADVGQGTYEEINRVSNTGARNFGWSRCEGKHNFYGPGPCSTSSGGLTAPVAEYGHPGGHCAVTGGYVYRGDVFEDLVGQYVLGDFCSGQMWTIGATSTTLVARRNTAATISSFGEGENGEIYMTDYGNGRLYRVVAPPFTDVVTSKFIDDITWLAYEGITSGCSATTFCPNGIVTRGQMATFLSRALDLPATSTDFFDDDEGSTHEGNINRIAAAGITSGCDANSFCPDGLVTRGQMASFLARAFNLPATGTDFFDDDDTNKHEANINRIAAAGITGGCGGNNYCPNGLVTRGQMAAFLHRALT
jgi:glucose/arabinose dehydrogenase